MYPRANQFPQSISLTTKKRSAQDQWRPPTTVGKVSNRPSVLPSIARQNCDWDTLRAMHLKQKPSNNRLGSRSQTSSLKKKDRDLDHAQLVGIIPESGEVLMHYHHMCNKTDTSCCQIKMGMVAYLGGDHHMFNKTDTTCQEVNLAMVAYLGTV